jgi:hypothetical protein
VVETPKWRESLEHDVAVIDSNEAPCNPVLPSQSFQSLVLTKTNFTCYTLNLPRLRYSFRLHNFQSVVGARLGCLLASSKKLLRWTAAAVQNIQPFHFTTVKAFAKGALHRRHYNHHTNSAYTVICRVSAVASGHTFFPVEL